MECGYRDDASEDMVGNDMLDESFAVAHRRRFRGVNMSSSIFSPLAPSPPRPKVGIWESVSKEIKAWSGSDENDRETGTCETHEDVYVFPITAVIPATTEDLIAGDLDSDLGHHTNAQS